MVTLGLFASSGEAQVSNGPATLAPASTEVPVWYIGRQLRKPIEVTVNGVAAQECPKARVSFQASGKGLASPDAAPGVWADNRCVVTVSWTLSDEVGRQHLTAQLVNGGSPEPVVFEARGRQGARLFFGAAYSPHEEAFTRFMEIEGEPPRLEQVEARAAFRPVMGVDFAPWPEWDRLRLAVGTGARDFDKQFFFGFSMLQAFVFGQPSEGSTVDLHAGIQLTRREIGLAGSQCEGVPVCKTSDLRFSGLAVFIGVDGASAFRGLASTILR